MRPDPGRPYYAAYDRRYRAVYEQGLSCWTADPQELAAMRSELADLVAMARLERGAHLVEFGCARTRGVGDDLCTSQSSCCSVSASTDTVSARGQVHSGTWTSKELGLGTNLRTARGKPKELTTRPARAHAIGRMRRYGTGGK